MTSFDWGREAEKATEQAGFERGVQAERAKWVAEVEDRFLNTYLFRGSSALEDLLDWNTDREATDADA